MNILADIYLLSKENTKKYKYGQYIVKIGSTDHITDMSKKVIGDKLSPIIIYSIKKLHRLGEVLLKTVI